MSYSGRALRCFLVAVAATLILAACTPAAPTGRVGEPQAGGSSPQARGPKRMTAAIIGEPAALVARMNTGAVSVPGADAVEQLVNAGMAEMAAGKLQPQLAEEVPTSENGRWIVLPDGRMETTWRIKPGAKWQDGTPVTSHDLVFTTVVDQDPELPVAKHEGYASFDAVEAMDERAVVVKWKKPYIFADTMFTRTFANPIPKHVLEPSYSQDKASFLVGSLWNQDFVGSGPFKVKEYAPGSHLIVAANDGYLHGRPKIDEIEVKFIPAMNTMLTAVVANTIDLTLGRGLSIEHSLEVRDQWKDGRAVVTPGSWIMIYPQFIDPNPPVVSNLQFRRALLHAIDRQSMVDTLQAGLTSIAHVYLNPADTDYEAIKDTGPRYAYDPARSVQMIQDLGYTRGADGAFRDGAGQRLGFETRSGVLEILQKATVSIADSWSRVGVTADPVLVPPQRILDRPYMWTFPAFLTLRQADDGAYLARYRSVNTPLASNNYVGGNYGRYQNAEWDALVERYFTTIPRAQRTEALRQVVAHINDQLNLMGLFYDAEVMFISNKLQTVTTTQSDLWDIHKWEVN
jgi:peptide/nickel transport system substrate-binding protein